MTLDGAFVKALVEDYENAPLSAPDRAMLDYVTQLTEDATRIRKKDQDSSYNGQDNERVLIPYTAMVRDFP